MSITLNLASDRWDTSSSVRTNPSTYELNLNEKDLSSKSWHLAGYSGILSLPEFSHLEDEHINYVMGLQLLEFVTKQARFEIECVNKVCQTLAMGGYKYEINDQFKLDALKIYTDEGYHSYFTQKLANQIITYFNVEGAQISSVVDIHFDKINCIGNKFPAEYSYLADLAVVCVAENQIVSDISSEMKTVVHEPIVSMFKNHLLDETFHAKYFAELLPVLWNQMSDYERYIFGTNLCESILTLGKPRTDIYYVSLFNIGFDIDTISRLIGQKYNNNEWNCVRLKDRMLPTLKLLQSIGVFDNEQVKSVFQENGLI